MKNDISALKTKYADIINMPHHVSESRQQMAIADRAAQFSPFAALTGYDVAISESGRLTEQFMEIDEEQKTVLNQKLQEIEERIGEEKRVSVTFFQPDERKDGGAYLKITGRVRKIDEYERCIVMEEGRKIMLDMIYDLEI